MYIERKAKPFAVIECQNPHEAFALENEERIIGWIASSLDKVGNDHISKGDEVLAYLLAAAPAMKEALEMAEIELAIYSETWPDDEHTAEVLEAVQHALSLTSDLDHGGA